MGTTALAMQIKRYLGTLEGMSGSRLQDVIDDEIFEVLAGVSWVREALAESAPVLTADEQRQVLSGLKALAA